MCAEDYRIRMKSRILYILFVLLLTVGNAYGQGFGTPDRMKKMDMAGGSRQGNHGNQLGRNNGNGRNQQDSLSGGGNKEIPKGYRMWTVDKRFGDIVKQPNDTVTHMFQNTIFTAGMRGEYNFLGNLGSPRINRIVIDRKTEDGGFLFMNPYTYFYKEPDEFLFMNTLSPYTNLSFNTAGNKLNGEDHFSAKFAVNAGKALGFGFKIDYLYGTGYHSNQNTSFFNTTLFGSYLGDRYNMHLLVGRNAQKIAENGGITNDIFITHPETISEQYSSSEIPTVLSSNWNRNKNYTAFLTQRYSVGFHHMVRMTDEEIAAKKFAWESKRDKLANDSTETDGEKKKLDELTDEDFMKREFVPVTSFIHTAEFGTYDRIYQAYRTPEGLYANDYLQDMYANGDSIFDQTKHLRLRNTFAISVLEGFKKWAFAGIKVFAASDLKTFSLPDEQRILRRETEHNLSIGGQISSNRYKTVHYKATGEIWLLGSEIGQVKIDGEADINFRLFGDTVTLATKAFFHNERPNYYLRHYHSRHFWWDDDLSMQTQTHIEGSLAYQKTRTALRFSADAYTNYTYLGNSFDMNGDVRLKNWNMGVRQSGDAISVITAAVTQDVTVGPWNWETVATIQKSTKQEVLPVPLLNVYSNMYLKFKIAKVLRTQLGADCRFFTSYEAPDYMPAIGQFVVQENENKVKIGGYPVINAYLNFNLKGTRFFVMYTHLNAGKFNHQKFFTPHYPLNNSVFRLGLSWNFYN